jgi:hypothetical protein
MKRILLIPALFAFTACVTEEAPLADLKNGNVEVRAYSNPSATDSLSVWMSLAESIPNHGATPDECLRLRTITVITANGAPGKLLTPGYYDPGDGFETECIPPSFDVDLPGQPATLDVVIDDGTGKIEMTVALDQHDHYAITQCAEGVFTGDSCYLQ